MTTNIIDNDTLVEVTNLTSHRVGYILDSGVRRRIAPHASMRLTAGELRELSYRSGGPQILTDFLRVANKNLAREFGVAEDTVEYDWTPEDVKKALTTDDIDVLLDALDYGPEGIKQELVDQAVKMEIADERRREAIKKATGADISVMIANNHMYDNQDGDAAEETTSQRRVQKKKASTGRRVKRQEEE